MFSTIKLEDYFDFQSADDIRIKGHRIGIEDVLNYYLEGFTPEEIQANLPTLSLEEIHATITYYLHKRSQVNKYLTRLREYQAKRYQKFKDNPPAIIQKLQAEKIRRTATNLEKE
ncbi:MAG: DUF433 domain-containing protein [Pleurocapsa minor HA4230-MV1]|jgi:uncharacterized protein (DUF433 family)|nr:DUF433 domain-containing protein [Pleurocapsa minor HA4230-MV1]